ncbi:LON peptidase substrate-binding domain-containing protein [Oceanospirillum sanctuarii]|uniref:LON peptidase substrate-binding domain-containing protein n=1 Tax=Oceanospirillum sanctuarii TaxID=1434821 RepID=UPI000A3B4E95|nr:LON peptidase substrate-binding domain-containing protein [Oceanospirillum sanctuarii]
MDPALQKTTNPIPQLPAQIRLVILPRVLFPQTFMPLNVLEPRYERMVKECLSDQVGIGILYQQEIFTSDANNEQLASLKGMIGTYGLISDWYPQPDNTLSLNIDGLNRFQIRQARQEADGLVVADVDWIEEENPLPITPEHQPLAQLLSGISHHPLAEGLDCHFDLQDAVSVSLNLAHLMPISDLDKQSLLECPSASKRLTTLRTLLNVKEG